jgi:hypothetical protein
MTRSPAQRRTLRAIALMLLVAIPSFLAGFPMPMAILIGGIFSTTCDYIRSQRRV